MRIACALVQEKQVSTASRQLSQRDCVCSSSASRTSKGCATRSPKDVLAVARDARRVAMAPLREDRILVFDPPIVEVGARSPPPGLLLDLARAGGRQAVPAGRQGFR